MKKRMIVVAALLASTIAGCIFYDHPCRTECFWDHGRRICERRCH
jgi:hypothetical protein